MPATLGGNQLPGFPLLIAAVWSIFPERWFFVAAAHSLLFAIALAYLVWTLRRWLGSNRVAMMAGIVVALSPLIPTAGIIDLCEPTPARILSLAAPAAPSCFVVESQKQCWLAGVTRCRRFQTAPGNLFEIALANPGALAVKIGASVYRIGLLAAAVLIALYWSRKKPVWLRLVWLALAYAGTRSVFMGWGFFMESRYLLQAVLFIEVAVAVGVFEFTLDRNRRARHLESSFST